MEHGVKKLCILFLLYIFKNILWMPLTCADNPLLPNCDPFPLVLLLQISRLGRWDTRQEVIYVSIFQMKKWEQGIFTSYFLLFSLVAAFVDSQIKDLQPSKGVVLVPTAPTAARVLAHAAHNAATGREKRTAAAPVPARVALDVALTPRVGRHPGVTGTWT